MKHLRRVMFFAVCGGSTEPVTTEANRGNSRRAMERAGVAREVGELQKEVTAAQCGVSGWLLDPDRETRGRAWRGHPDGMGQDARCRRLPADRYGGHDAQHRRDRCRSESPGAHGG